MQNGCHSVNNTSKTMCILSDTILYFQQIKVVNFNNTPIPDMVVDLFQVDGWSSNLRQKLTTDSDGVASFSLNTTNLNGDIRLVVSEIILNSCHVNVC